MLSLVIVRELVLFCLFVYLFNDGHILHLRSETVAVRRRMIMVLDDNDGQMTPGEERGLNLLKFCLQLRKTPGENFNQEIDQTGDRIRARLTTGDYVTFLNTNSLFPSCT